MAVIDVQRGMVVVEFGNQIIEHTGLFAGGKTNPNRVTQGDKHEDQGHGKGCRHALV